MFPADPLDLTVQIYHSGAWHDITADVFGRDAGPVGITRGRSGEGGRAAPTSMGLSLNNATSNIDPSIVGRYSARNPRSDLYGLIGQNTPIRGFTGTEHVGAGGGSESATTSHQAPSVTATGAGLLINGWLSALGNYLAPATPLAETDGGASTMRTARLAVAAAGPTPVRTATFSTSQAYASASAVANGSSIAVEETLTGVSDTCQDIELTTASDTEAGWWLVAVQGWTRGVDVDMPSAPAGDDGGWIPLADSGVIAAGLIYVHVRIWARRVTTPGAQTVIFGGVPEDVTLTADNHANLYVLSGVDDWDVRGTCEVPAWPPSWDISGRDVWVSLDAAGILRRLGQGASPLRSPLRRALAGSGATQRHGAGLLPVAYWPLEDAEGSTQAASGLAGGTPMRVEGGSISWATVSSPGSAELPDLRQSTGTLVGTASGLSGAWAVEFLVQYTSTDSWTCVTVELAGGPYTRLQIAVGSSVTVTAYTDASNSTLLSSSTDLSDGEPHWIAVTALESAPSVEYELLIDGASAGTSGLVTGAAGQVGVRVHPRSSGDTATVGQVGVYASLDEARWVLLVEPALRGHAGERAGRRIERLCREEGIALHPVGDLDDTARMGAQGTATLLTLLRECEDADGGILYEPREALGLAYRCRTARYNLPVTLALDYSQGEVAPPLEPTDDDRYTRNDVIVTRTGGSWARYEVAEGPLNVRDPRDDPQGVGRYDESVQLNVELDAQLPDQASWRAHLGTVDEERYPTVHVNLARLCGDGKTDLARTAAALDVGDRLTIANLPAWMPPDDVDQQVEGITEVLGQFARDLYYVCVPNSPWRVGVLEDEVLGRVDTDGSELDVDFVAGTDTSMSVAVTDGPLWITTATKPTMFPFEIRCGGVVLEVTAISGVSSPQTFTITQTPVNGVEKILPAGTALSLAHPWRLAL